MTLQFIAIMMLTPDLLFQLFRRIQPILKRTEWEREKKHTGEIKKQHICIRHVQ